MNKFPFRTHVLHYYMYDDKSTSTDTPICVKVWRSNFDLRTIQHMGVATMQATLKNSSHSMVYWKHLRKGLKVFSKRSKEHSKERSRSVQRSIRGYSGSIQGCAGNVRGCAKSVQGCTSTVRGCVGVLRAFKGILKKCTRSVRGF